MLTAVYESNDLDILDIVSSRVGIVRSLRQMNTELVELAPIELYEAQLADFEYAGEDTKKTRLGVGKGATEEAAVMGAIGEAVERYCSLQPNYDAVFESSVDQLGSSAISPSELVLYSEEQYETGAIPYPRFRSGHRTGWVRGRFLPGGHEAFVPASFSYLGPVGEHWCHNTSNGLAAGPDLDSAVLGGLCELVERDAFLITWMNQLAVPEVTFGRAHGLANAIRAHYVRRGLEIRVFNATMDIPIYTMMAFAIDRTGTGPSAVIGLGCSLDPVEALTKALFEMCQGRVSELWRYRQRVEDERITSIEQVRRLEDHGAIFAEAHMLTELDFLLDSPHTVPLDSLGNASYGDPAADLAQSVELLSKAGSRVAFVDLTTPDIAPFGIRVIRAVATGLQPIHFGYGRERLGGTRVFDVPRVTGYDSRTRTVSDLNRCPHPLP